MSAWELPTTVEVAGRSFAIRSDFRAVLDALAALTDPDLTQQEQYVACLQILYPRWKELPDANAASTSSSTSTCATQTLRFGRLLLLSTREKKTRSRASAPGWWTGSRMLL